MGSPTYGPLNKRFTLTGIFLSSFFFHSLFPFSLVFDCSPSGLNLNLTAFRRHSQATHPEEAPCQGVPIASSPFPVKILGALCCSCLLTYLFPILLTEKIMNLATTSCSLTKLQCLEQVWRIVDMAPHSSTLAWKIPWTEEPGRLQSMGLQRVRHD